MSLSKTYIKSRNSFKVAFELPKDIGSDKTEIRVLGEFNDWNWENAPVLKRNAGSYKAVVELESGKTYQYRYLIDGQTWINDSIADGYTPSPYNVENCVVNLEATCSSTKKVVNFTKIEGIGPKINQILIDAGYSSFKELSKAKKQDLNAILELAGKRYQMHDPSTWPKQAKLLADNKIEELKKLQKELKGGRKR